VLIEDGAAVDRLFELAEPMAHPKSLADAAGCGFPLLTLRATVYSGPLV